MKKILIVIHDMEIGGAQKSLAAFLQTLAESGRAAEYAISVLPIKPSGAFLKQIPAAFHVLQPDHTLRWMGSHMSQQLLTRYFSLRGLIGECAWILSKKLGLLPKKLNNPQRLWQCWKKLVPHHSEHYDIAIAYIEGLSSYYVMDKVDADKKVLWMHSEYQKQAFDPAFDRAYFDAADAVVTISEQCRECILKDFPHCGTKVAVLENISAYSDILRRSQMGECPEFDGCTGAKLVTVARLNPQKGVDIGAEAAAMLRAKGFDFRWIVVGEGSEREYLTELVEKHALQDHFLLIGARENPYTYMRQADIIVQPSRVEGKSIVLDEAKMLCKPIVATRYATVGDSIDHGSSGWTTEMNPQALAEGILHVWSDSDLRKRFTSNLTDTPKGNPEELEKYIKTMF